MLLNGPSNPKIFGASSQMFVDNDVVKSVDNFGVKSVDICVGLVVVDIFVR